MQSVKVLLGLFLICAGVYVGVKVLPHYMANYQFQDSLDSQIQLDLYSGRSADEIKETVMHKAKEADLKLGENQVTVYRDRDELAISADYVVRVDLPIRPIDLHFTPSSRNRK
jgi:hypothetical protein